MQSAISLEQLFSGPVVGSKPRILDSDQAGDEIFTAEYAKTYDTDMVEALRDLYSAWTKGVDLATAVVDKDDRIVLDEGVGTGRVTEAILRRHPAVQVIGLDRSLAFLKVCQERLARVEGASGRTVLKVGDLGQPLPFADETFDAIVSHWVIQYLSRETQVRLFRENYRALKPGGKFFMNVSMMPFKVFVPVFIVIYKIRGVWDQSYKAGIDRIMKHLPVVRKFNEGYKTGAMHLPKVAEVEAMLRESGFEKVEIIDYAKMPAPVNWKSFVAFIVATKAS